jgi:hypothetical protein
VYHGLQKIIPATVIAYMNRVGMKDGGEHIDKNNVAILHNLSWNSNV